MKKIEVFDIKSKDKWIESLNKLPNRQQDIYFTPEYIDIYEKNGDGAAKCFVFSENNDTLLYPFLERNIPGYDEYKDITTAYGYGGMILSRYDDNFIKSFRKAFNDYCIDTNIVTEFIRFHPLLNNQDLFKGFGNIVFSRETVYVDLSKEIEQLFNEFHSQNRSDIRKALKSDLKLAISNDKDFVDTFINLYYQTMQKNQASNYYFFSKEYFYKLFENLTYNTFLFNVIFNNEIISSAIYIGYGNYFHYHLAASNYKYQKLRANNFILYKAIEFAKKNNYKYIHLGGGATDSDEDSLLKFKKRFSKSYTNFYVGTSIINNDIYDLLYNNWQTTYPEKIEKYQSQFFFPLYRA